MGPAPHSLRPTQRPSSPAARAVRPTPRPAVSPQKQRPGRRAASDRSHCPRSAPSWLCLPEHDEGAGVHRPITPPHAALLAQPLLNRAPCPPPRPQGSTCKKSKSAWVSGGGGLGPARPLPPLASLASRGANWRQHAPACGSMRQQPGCTRRRRGRQPAKPHARTRSIILAAAGALARCRPRRTIITRRPSHPAPPNLHPPPGVEQEVRLPAQHALGGLAPAFWTLLPGGLP